MRQGDPVEALLGAPRDGEADGVYVNRALRSRSRPGVSGVRGAPWRRRAFYLSAIRLADELAVVGLA